MPSLCYGPSLLYLTSLALQIHIDDASITRCFIIRPPTTWMHQGLVLIEYESAESERWATLLGGAVFFSHFEESGMPRGNFQRLAFLELPPQTVIPLVGNGQTRLHILQRHF